MNLSGHKYTKDKGNKRKTTRVQKACLSCRKRKQGCEEQRPCFRCVEKGVECVEVDEKKKRGRARTYPPKIREKSNRPRNEEVIDYGEDENEDSYSCTSEADDPLSSEEDHKSPRGYSTNSETSCSGHEHLSRSHRKSDVLRNSNGSVTASVVAHTLQLDGSSPSFSLNSSNMSDSSRSSSPDYFPDSPSQEDGEKSDGEGVEMQISPVNSNCHVEIPFYRQFKECFVPIKPKPKPNSGMNLVILLPFIVNMCKEPVIPFPDDDDPQKLFVNRLPTTNPDDQISCLCPESFELREKLMSLSISYISSAIDKGSFPSHYSEEGDSRAQSYLKNCLLDLLIMQRSDHFINSLQQANDTCNNILHHFKRGDWLRGQNALQEIETMQFDHFGQGVEPGIVYWTSGGRIHHANEAFCKLVGFTLQELRVDNLNDSNMARAPHLFLHPEETMKVMNKMMRVVSCEKFTYHHMETRLLTKQRIEVPISCCMLSIKESRGGILLNIGIFV